ncbi:fumarylacetoacetate hydrolase family protein [Tabrizicola sp.]|uniref:fumarylacetoacetate hydrolase family protein n=1 Tax=Tabrizicola sp. TaxID=2005166 RepID=UPI001A451A55|nr:fumarylacetoacetate hydrolase family protein [Tabrizicola sp.]MBL9075542.1 fumarylacetoacetate hydrolase family protein [Tabrizicola sp.]
MAQGSFVGRVWRDAVEGPSVVTFRAGRVIDVTSRETPTMRDLLERDDPAGWVASAAGPDIGASEALLDGTIPGVRLLAPIDLQAVKACGVTFARSMIERVIEERAAGDASRAAAIRDRVGAIIGDSLKNLKAGSEKAAEVKAALIEEGLWSQYLEVGIGPDAEVFTKAQVLSSVGHGADVGLHPVSKWNNPEPEMVLAVDSRGRVKGATLGNDVNLRDFEGRSALLLGKAKDNNASSAIGPMIRLFDAGFGIEDVRKAELTLTVTGEDGFRLDGRSDLSLISRDPLDLVAQTLGRHHQYPDGLALFLGTSFAPIMDRDAPGQGFTHHLGDVVTISSPLIGTLRNRVRLSTECEPWTFGAAQLMRNLARRGLL